MKPVRAALNSITPGGGRATTARDRCYRCGGHRLPLLGASRVDPFALAVLLTFLLSPMVNALQRTGLARLPSVGVVVTLTLALVITIGWIVMSQVKSLADDFPKYRHNIRRNIRDLRAMGKGGVLEKVQETVTVSPRTNQSEVSTFLIIHSAKPL
jgi:predicted PurR-regulated permease PerM